MYSLSVKLFVAAVLYYQIFSLCDFKCTAKKIQYISTERPSVTYINTKYVSFANLTSKRYGRRNPLYYVGIHLNVLYPVDSNVSIDFYFYEYLTNVYKRSFIEMHFELCHMIHNDPFFGAPLKQGKFAKPCPYPPGEYHLSNMTIDSKVIPNGFPFRKGRIYANISSLDTKELVLQGHIDMEVKEISSNQGKRRTSVKIHT